MNKYWVGTNQYWHDDNNWSLTSGGAGGAGIPTAIDDVFFDANGDNLIWFTPAFECRNLTFELSASSKFFLFEQGGIINGDFLQEAGYFGGTGGGGYVLEFKGNWQSTGGTFAIGTGTGVDLTCLFSGIDKTYQLNQTGAASYQNFSVTGSYTFSGTRLVVANIYQKISVTGTMTIAFGKRIDLDGNDAGFDVFTGTINGDGRFRYGYRNTSVMPVTGTISIKYWLFSLQGALAVLNPRTYESNCEVEIEYNNDGQIFRLDGSARHYFLGELTILCDATSVNTAEFDCASNNAEMWIGGKFDIYKDAFPNATFTIKFGNGMHVFKGTVDFYFSYTSLVTHLVVDAGKGTIILYPTGRQLIPLPVP